MEHSSKRDVPDIKPPAGYSTPPIRLKRSGQFGSHGSVMDTSAVPSYATLPRNTRNSARRSSSLVPNSPHHNQTRSLFDPISNTRTVSAWQAPSPGLSRAVSARGVDDTDMPVTVSISTTPRMKINRISKEEQVAKQEERRRRKQEYFHSTPVNKIKVTQRDLQAYVQFYEKKLSSIVAAMDGSIAVEKTKQDSLESRLKCLLNDNDTLSMQLAGIRKDLKKCEMLTETPV